jgi:Zn-dependent peptidase ImmA (M78 family)
MTDALHFSPTVLDWVADQAGLSLHALAERVSKRAANHIERGELTTTQAMKFAKEAGVPFGYLFLSVPPAERSELPVADFRTLPEAHPLSKSFYDVYDDIEFKQSWYREYLQREGAAPLPFVGKFRESRITAEVVAMDIRATLAVEGAQRSSKTSEQLYSLLVRNAETLGVLVFKNGIVGNNTRRGLSVSEFRGFAISDPLAPLIFINGADAAAAWTFTLLHELAHIWLGESGISDASPSSQNRQEILCNAIAADALVPRAAFVKAWEQATGIAEKKVGSLRQIFKVSTLVIGRRAFDLNLVGKDFYDRMYAEVRAQANNADKTSGGNFYSTLAVRNSKRFSRSVAALASSGGISLREAGQLLNTNPNNVVVFHAQQQTLPT